MNLIAQETRPETSYRLIPLTRGQFAIVDEVDFEWLSQWKWNAHWCACTQSFYAVRTDWINGKRCEVSMHRKILGLEYGDVRQGDHIKAGKTLDNRRGNLRIATKTQNSQNRRKKRNTPSGFKGVSYYKRNGKWVAFIRMNGKNKHLGYHSTPQLAYEAYCKAARDVFGEFAHLG